MQNPDSPSFINQYLTLAYVSVFRHHLQYTVWSICGGIFRRNNLYKSLRLSRWAMKVEVLKQSWRQIHPWWTAPHTDFITEIISVFLVKFVMPSNPFSCCSPIVMAAPPMKPIIEACDRKSIRKPSLQIPSTAWNTPAKKCWCDDKPMVINGLNIIYFIPDQGAQQDGNNSYWPNGNISGAPHHGIYQGW